MGFWQMVFAMMLAWYLCAILRALTDWAYDKLHDHYIQRKARKNKIGFDSELEETGGDSLYSANAKRTIGFKMECDYEKRE